LPRQSTKLIPPVYFPFISGLGIGLLSPEGVYLTGLARGVLLLCIPAFSPPNVISVISPDLVFCPWRMYPAMLLCVEKTAERMIGVSTSHPLHILDLVLGIPFSTESEKALGLLFSALPPRHRHIAFCPFADPHSSNSSFFLKISALHYASRARHLAVHTATRSTCSPSQFSC